MSEANDSRPNDIVATGRHELVRRSATLAKRGLADLQLLRHRFGPPPPGFAWTQTGKLVVKVWPAGPLYCPECGNELQLKAGRFGPFFTCTAFPKCRCSVNLRGEAKKQAEIEMPPPPRHKPIATDITCKECGEPTMVRRGRSGMFPNCSKYPKCKSTMPSAHIEDSQTFFDAVRAGNTELVRCLMKTGVDVNAKDADGSTPLHHAALRACREMLDVLVHYGADVDAKGGANHERPLHVAADKGHKDIVEALLRHGANVDATAGAEATPLHWAAGAGQSGIVEVLLSHGANIEAQSENGARPLHAAAYDGHRDTVEALLQRGASVDPQTFEGETPLHWAAKMGHSGVVEVLLRHGANVDAQSNMGVRPLHEAARKGHKDLLEVLLQRGAKVDARTKEGATPLGFAIHASNPAVIELLRQHGEKGAAGSK